MASCSEDDADRVVVMDISSELMTESFTQDLSQGYGLHCFDMRTGTWDEVMCEKMGIPVDFLPHEYDRRCVDRDRKDIYQSGHAFRNLREVYLRLYRHRIHQGSDRRNPSFLQSVLSFKDMGEMGHLSIHLYKHPTLRSFRCGSIHLCQILKS